MSSINLIVRTFQFYIHYKFSQNLNQLRRQATVFFFVSWTLLQNIYDGCLPRNKTMVNPQIVKSKNWAEFFLLSSWKFSESTRRISLNVWFGSFQFLEFYSRKTKRLSPWHRSPHRPNIQGNQIVVIFLDTQNTVSTRLGTFDSAWFQSAAFFP